MSARPAEARPLPRALSNWLFAVAFLVLTMIVVGGITRLTESGLSITRWEPVTGTLPPLNEADWAVEFDRYRDSPQYQQINRGMSLAEFKRIYFWEYVHRLLGRVIGLAFFIPWLWFAWRRAIPRGYGWKLAGLFVLGGLQGAIGWWMVASGLVDRPDVSHIRLAVHLLTAFAIFGALIWVALDLRRLAGNPDWSGSKMPLIGLWTICLLFLQFLFGAYVAGLEAGYAFNSWPRMGDEFFPSQTPMLEPWLRNLVDNPIMVQFIHRWLAMIVAVVALALAAAAARNGHVGWAWGLAAATIAQVLLGIFTLLSGVQIDIAVAHQGMAAILLGAAVGAAHRIGEQKP